MVAGPGIERGRRSDALVILIDLTATFLDYEVVDLAAEDPARVAKLRDLMKQGSYRPI